MEKLIVDQDLCIGCGSCVNICEEVFDFHDEGMTAVAIEENNELENLDESTKEKALDALDACPVDAIKKISNEEN